MHSATASIDIASCANTIWRTLTSAQDSAEYLGGLRLVSRWQPDGPVDAFHACARIATGMVVIADPPRMLVFRLEDPVTGDIDCWVSWSLDESDPGITRVTVTVDSAPYDPPVDSVRLLSNLKTYLETSARLAAAGAAAAADARRSARREAAGHEAAGHGNTGREAPPPGPAPA